MKKSELFHLVIPLCLAAFACIKFKTSKHLSPPQSHSQLVVKYEMVSATHSHPHVYHLYFNMIFAALLTFKSCLVAHSHLPDWLMLRLRELIPTTVNLFILQTQSLFSERKMYKKHLVQ